MNGGPIQTSPTSDVTDSLLLAIDDSYLKVRSNSSSSRISSLSTGFPSPSQRVKKIKK